MIFGASPVLIALNCADAQERLARAEALASLVEHFQIELKFDEDRFVGLTDALPPLRAELAVA
jgi:hypothetical protein